MEQATTESAEPPVPNDEEQDPPAAQSKPPAPPPVAIRISRIHLIVGNIFILAVLAAYYFGIFVGWQIALGIVFAFLLGRFDMVRRIRSLRRWYEEPRYAEIRKFFDTDQNARVQANIDFVTTVDPLHSWGTTALPTFLVALIIVYPVFQDISAWLHSWVLAASVAGLGRGGIDHADPVLVDSPVHLGHAGNPDARLCQAARERRCASGAERRGLQRRRADRGDLAAGQSSAPDRILYDRKRAAVGPFLLLIPRDLFRGQAGISGQCRLAFSGPAHRISRPVDGQSPADRPAAQHLASLRRLSRSARRGRDQPGAAVLCDLLPRRAGRPPAVQRRLSRGGPPAEGSAAAERQGEPGDRPRRTAPRAQPLAGDFPAARQREHAPARDGADDPVHGVQPARGAGVLHAGADAVRHVLQFGNRRGDPAGRPHRPRGGVR